MNNQNETFEAAVALDVVADIAGARVENAPSAQVEVSGISLDSNAVEAGAVFAALPGTRVHGATYAASSRAAAILTDEAGWAILSEAESSPGAGRRGYPRDFGPGLRRNLRASFGQAHRDRRDWNVW